MTTYKIPKALLASPSQSEQHSDIKTSQSSGVTLQQMKFGNILDQSISIFDKKAHAKRIADMRKELEFIQNTEWKYKPIEFYIGQ